MFWFVRNPKSPEFPEGNCKMAWGWLVTKYGLQTAYLVEVKTWVLQQQIGLCSERFRWIDFEFGYSN